MNKVFFLLIVCMNISSCTRADIHTSFIESIRIYESISINSIDTIRNNDIVFYLPNTNSKLLQSVLYNDMKNSVENTDYSGAEITYEIKQASPLFFSLVKSVYIETANSPKGYFSWDECLNFYKYKDGIFEIKYYSNEQEVNEKVNLSIKRGYIEEPCLREDWVSIEEQEYFFQNGRIYLHNPISFPTCWIDLEMNLNTGNINFNEIHLKD
jgi:hypothetical protein